MQTTSPSFPEITVTPTERRFYNGIASAILRKTVAEHTRCKGYIPTSRWRHVRSRKGMNVFRSTRTRDRESTNANIMIGSGQIAGTLDEVMDGLYCDSTADLRCVSALLNHKLVDCAVLNVIARRTPSDPFQFEGIKWRALKAPWGISTTHDVLTYERMGMIVDKQGTKVAYHVIQSIDRIEWPADASVKGFKREQASVCYLYRRDSHGLVRCFFWGEVVDLTAVTQRAAEYVIAGTWLNVVRSVECARAKRCSALIAARTQHSIEGVGSTCRVCYKRAGLLRNTRLAVCAGCSQTTCKSCSSQQQLFQLDHKSGEPEQQRFCKLCLGRVRTRTSAQTSPTLPSSMTAPTTVPIPMQRSYWDSAPASLGIVESTLSLLTPPSPPNQRNVSRRIRYDLLAPPSHPGAVLDTQSKQRRAKTSYDNTPAASRQRVVATHSMNSRECLVESHDSSMPTNSASSSRSSGGSASITTHAYIDISCQTRDDTVPIESRCTETLGEFDLDLDLDLASAVDGTADIHNCRTDPLERTHHELVFTWRSDYENGSDNDKASFLDDLYVDARPRIASM